MAERERTWVQEREEEVKRYNKLKNRQLELEVLIAAIEDHLKENGYLLTDKQNWNSKTTASGIRIKDKLSFRGREKASEFFDKLDEMKTGTLGFPDIRAMHSLNSKSGFVHQLEYCRSETWEMHMADIGINTHDGRMSRDDFVKYRDVIELKYPLALDLARTKLGMLPNVQLFWVRLKNMIKEAISYRSDERKMDEYLNLDEVSYILCSSNLPYSKYEFKSALCIHSQFENVMVDLLAKHLKHNLFLRLPAGVVPDDQPFLKGAIIQPQLKLGMEQVNRIKPNNLIAWVFSNCPKPNTCNLYQTLLTLKYTSIRLFRKFYWSCGEIWNIGTHLRERMIFRAKTVKNVEQVDHTQTSSYRATLLIGETEQTLIEEGSNIYWKLSGLENPAEYFHQLCLPRDSGCGIVIDLAQTSLDNSNNEIESFEDEIKKCCLHIKQQVLHHIGEELNRSLQFRGLFVFPAKNLVDDRPVVRIAFLFRKQISVDNFLAMMHIPYCLTDIIKHFTGEIAMNSHIANILKKTTASFDNYFHLNASVFVEFNRAIVISLLDAVKIAFATGLTSDSLHFKSKSGVDGMQNEVVEKWESIRHYFKPVVEYCVKLLRVLSYTTTTDVSFSFKSPSELIKWWSKWSSWVKKYCPMELLKVPGAIPKLYDKQCQRFQKDVEFIFRNLKMFLETKQDKREEERLRLLRLSEKERKQELFNKSKQEMLERLVKLGVETNERDIYDDNSKTPKDYAHDVRDDQFKNDINLYETLERVRKCVEGIHSCDIILGKCRVGLSFQGFDVMDLFPQPPSIIHVVASIAEREKESAKLDSATLA